MKNIVKSLVCMTASAITSLLMLAGLSSCLTHITDYPEPEPGRNVYRLQFQMVTDGNSGTRAADLSGDLEGTAAENFLDINDIKFFIFDKDKNFLGALDNTVEVVAGNEAYTLYNVTAELDLPYFFDNIDNQIEFYLMGVANSSGWGLDMPVMAEGANISSLFDNGLILNYRPSTPALMLAATPDVGATQRQRFPMAGVQYFSIPGNMLLTTYSSLPFDLTFFTGKKLNLLRSMAKIEIIDRINIGDEEIYDAVTHGNGLRIIRAQMNGFMTRGRLLPLMPQWNRNDVFETQQAISPSVPTDPDYHIPPVLNADNTIAAPGALTDYTMPFAYDEYATNLREDKCPVYSCYIYEYSQNALAPQTQPPYFTLTTGAYTHEGVTIPEAIYAARMANYTEGVAEGNLTELLRNHIYRFEIAGVGERLSVNWTVCEMDTAEAYITYN